MKSDIFKNTKTIGDPNGTVRQRERFAKTQKAKQRNAARKEWRKAHPEQAGKQLHCWPLPQ